MHVLFLAHSTVRKFEAPDQAGSYDRFELKLSRQVAPLLKEWADVVLFCNYVTKIAEKDGGKKRGVGGKERILFATHTAACDAKNRHGLPDKLPFTVEALDPVFGAAPKQETSGKPAEAPAPDAAAEPSFVDRLFQAFDGHMADVVDFLIARGQLQQGQDLSKLDEDYAKRVLGAPERFLAAVESFKREQEVAK